MAFPKEKEIEIPLLKELIKAGGSAKPNAIMDRIASYFPALTSENLEECNPNGECKWKNMVRWTRQYLVSRGAINNSTRGIWEITEKGRQMVESVEKVNSNSDKRGKKAGKK
jgi:restriction system protein